MKEEFKETARTLLKIITGKEYVFFTNKCNESIKLALKMAHNDHRTHALIQDEGGWLTYKKYTKQIGFELTKMVTNDGLIHPKELDHYGSDEVLLINSLAGYIAMHDMSSIHTYCLKNDIFLINDVSGSIGSKESQLGDVIVGSFGDGKPVNLGIGGFIAFNKNYLELFDTVIDSDFEEPIMEYSILIEKLKNLEQRKKFLTNKVKQIKEDLKGKPIVHEDNEHALNVVVRFNNEEEKKELEDYCNKNKLEYTVCPREIRIEDDAISIEVKRLKE